MDKRQVRKVINKIRPKLKADGGDVKLVSVTSNGTVRVKLLGACKGCPMSTRTIKNSIEKRLKREIPEVKRVKAV